MTNNDDVVGEFVRETMIFVCQNVLQLKIIVA